MTDIRAGVEKAVFDRLTAQIVGAGVYQHSPQDAAPPQAGAGAGRGGRVSETKPHDELRAAAARPLSLLQTLRAVADAPPVSKSRSGFKPSSARLGRSWSAECRIHSSGLMSSASGSIESKRGTSAR